MTPKENAKELFDKIYNLDNRAWFDIAKQCALVCVDEILDNIVDENGWNIDYWNDVKREIMNL